MFDIETITQWLTENYPWLIEMTATGAIFSGALIWINKSIIPMLKNKLMQYLGVLLTQMFGVETADAERIVQTSPIVTKLSTEVDNFMIKQQKAVEEATAEHLEFVETTLINYALKLKSGVLKNDEYVLIKQAFDMMLARWRDKLPLEVVDQLNKLVA